PAGALLARAPAHVVRLSLVYALPVGRAVVRGSRLGGAAALWAYSELSVRFVFGDMLRDRRAEELVTALREAGAKGLKREEVRDLFSRNLSAVRVDMLLGDLARQGLAHARKASSKGPGRPAVTWYPGPAPEVS
ncbi:MAG: hypothetical protein KBB14_11070, partial [Thermoanaerobaculia bacterium]|nr:hypothetical protein [Thermoanaerobaculia bacterium]